MSTLRNAAPRRPHKERSQPQTREKKWGLLEKHKDYSLRAKDYNLKQAKLKQLSQKARERNPDEFAFGMMSAEKGKQGQHGRNTEENRLSHDAVKLLKSQDAGYLRVVAGRGRREVERLEEAVKQEGVMREHGVACMSASATKIVFDKEGHTPRGKKRKASGEVLPDVPVVENITTMNGVDQMLDMNEAALPSENALPKWPGSKKVSEAELRKKSDLRAARKKRQRLAELRATKLVALKKRQREIIAAATELELQRAKMAGTVGGVNKNGVRFKMRERKR